MAPLKEFNHSENIEERGRDYWMNTHNVGPIPQSAMLISYNAVKSQKRPKDMRSRSLITPRMRGIRLPLGAVGVVQAVDLHPKVQAEVKVHTGLFLDHAYDLCTYVMYALPRRHVCVCVPTYVHTYVLHTLAYVLMHRSHNCILIAMLHATK